MYMRAYRQGSSRSPTDTEVQALRERERERGIKRAAGLFRDVKMEKGSSAETDQICRKTSGHRAQVLQPETV